MNTEEIFFIGHLVWKIIALPFIFILSYVNFHPGHWLGKGWNGNHKIVLDKQVLEARKQCFFFFFLNAKVLYQISTTFIEGGKVVSVIIVLPWFDIMVVG